MQLVTVAFSDKTRNAPSEVPRAISSRSSSPMKSASKIAARPRNRFRRTLRNHEAKTEYLPRASRNPQRPDLLCLRRAAAVTKTPNETLRDNGRQPRSYRFARKRPGRAGRSNGTARIATVQRRHDQLTAERGGSTARLSPHRAFPNDNNVRILAQQTSQRRSECDPARVFT